MITPDMDLICEIMLMSEGYADGKVLARKFMMLYRLSEALLSQQKHYDWKLRAVKTTLNVAGGMRRADRENTEDRVLLRALRDFNLGKLILDDVGIFLGMIDDLFPKQREHVVRARELDFEEKVVEAAKSLHLQAEEVFVTKITQLREIAAVRWSVFVLGPAGCGKSEMIKSLAKAQNLFGEKATINVLNPKSVTRNELYGYIHPATREWKDGLLSQIFRDLANTHTCKSEYLVLDGDIDAEWIESMNTVMDDNKTLTLASNERIPLTPPMRLLLEIENMREASPATVSRGGVIFMNDTDVGWRPYVVSWIANREYDVEKQMLKKLFDSYVGKVFEWMKKNCETIVPLPEINKIQHLCYILEGILGNGDNFAGQCKTLGQDSAQQILESYFIYASIWAFGGATFTDKQYDHRKAFDRWWKEEMKTIRVPDEDMIFDYCVDESLFPLTVDNDILSSPFISWNRKVEPYAHNSSTVFGNIYVATMESQRVTYLLDLLMNNKHACMLVGGAGTGKTTIMADKLRKMNSEQYTYLNINLNCFTDSMLLQGAMESVLEKKTGRTFGPTGTKKMVYFIDDINMPQVDKYGTQQPIALLRQLFDYAGWYSRDKLTWRDIQNVQCVSCLNPTAGSFFIDPRLQRAYCTYTVQMPSPEALFCIFNSILSGHLATFSQDVLKKSEDLTKATIEIQALVANTFYPTAIKFHYIFNLRDVGNIFEGILRSRPAFYTNVVALVRLWTHECERVFSDRMITEPDMTRFEEILEQVTKKYFEKDLEKIMAKPNIHTTFTTTTGNDDERPYCGIQDEEKLSKIMAEKLAEYNETNAVMDLVLFTMAIEHVCRITRVIDKPRGNALLVGVGGSGKQSLSRLSASICQYEIFQITVTATYGMNDFRDNLLSLYTRAGVKGIGTCFILTDGQIVNERMMVFLNDMLASGNIPDVFTKEVKDEFMNGVRNDCKQAGIVDTPENLWSFFIEKSRRYLHLCLCFSPVGDKFRIRARQFPALINCTTFDYFHPWPQEALVSVANRFIKGNDGIRPEDTESVARHMAFVHLSVNEASEQFLASERRYNYTTPKSYLDLIDLYKTMLKSKKEDIHVLKDRLENGLEKMNSAAEQVAELQENLIKDMAVVEEKKEATDRLLVVVGQEQNSANDQKEKATGEEAKCAKIAEEVKAFQAECEKEMAAAEPIIQAAIEALNSLDKKQLTELKALASPPPGVDDVTAGVMVLLSQGKIPKDLSWGAAKKLMGNVDQFLSLLVNFDKDNTPPDACKWIEINLFTKEGFNPVAMKSKSSAAAGMCAWVVNVVKYYRIYEVVEPKRKLLAEANEKLDGANTQLAAVRAHVASLEEKLQDLENQFAAATAEKNEAIAAAEKTQRKANLATRLVNGLADENVRWTEAVKSFDAEEAQYVGDVLVASAFVSYVGAFNAKFRNSLVFEKWLPDMTEKKIPMSEGIVPLKILADDAEIAQWNSQGLPTDSVSIQNGAIIANCKRWPLFIDPQLQGIKYIRKKHTLILKQPKPDDWNEEEKGEFVPDPSKDTVKEMKCVQLTQGKYLNAVEMAISNGEAIMIENIREEIDAVLDPVLMRSIIRRGRANFIKLGDKEVEFDPNFKLYLQSKLSNPHYKPEIAAQTTIINFMITLDGLEEQLLALVVNKERPDLEEKKVELMEQQNGFKVKLKSLEDELLFRLSSSTGDILEDIELIEGLERAKVTANEIQEKQKIAKETEQVISTARKAYIPVAVRGALTYFLIDQLWVLDHMYRFSMANFVSIFKKGMDAADREEEEEEGDAENKKGREEEAAQQQQGGATSLTQRVNKLVDSACYTCFAYVAQGLFERHKLVFACQLCFQVQQRSGDLNAEMFDFLIKGPRASGIDNPLAEWLDEGAWLTCHALKEFEIFDKLPEDLIGSAKRFREWFELERPEEAALPGDWRKLPEFEKLLLTRALRTDRMSEALSSFVKQIMGDKYVTSQPFNLVRSFKDVTPQTPVFFILSAGVDPVKDTEKLGKDFGVGFDHGNFGLVSLGQGQEPVAEKAIETSYKNGGWAFLQNIHLTPRWTGGYLEKRCDDLDGAHEFFRMFLSAEPAKLPINILQVCVKLTNEPPEGLQPNLRKNWLPFTDDFFDASAKPGELKSITFALCLFHSVVIERKKFGPQGWNRVYPFNFGDLMSCAQVAMNYLEANPKVPWDDLRYIFGEIMYGGHVTDFFDRRLVSNYLQAYMCDDLIEGFEIFPGFRTPSNAGNARDIVEHIMTAFPQESPTAFGLHPNAEIGFRLMQADTMFTNIRELQPRTAGSGGGLSVSDRAKAMLDDIVEKLPEPFIMLEILEKVEERTPYINVFLQEIERIQELTAEIRRSLAELDLGLKGDLQISESMEALMKALSDATRPSGWEKYAYPSKRPLGTWVTDLLARYKQLSDWTSDMQLPKSTWLSGLFNPQSFLTAVMQTTARKNDWPLDKTVTQTEVTKKAPEEIPAASKEGAFIHGAYMEGARWDDKSGQIEESRPKELYAKMPVMLIKAAMFTGVEQKDTYTCPVYKTQDRGPTFVFNAGLRSKSLPSKWILGGVALLMDVS